MRQYNLTDKLAFDDDPVLIIKDVKLTVKSDAEVVLKLMDIVQGEGDLAGLQEAEALLFSSADRKKIARLKLKTPDYITLLQYAMGMATGEDVDKLEEDQGE